VTTQGMQEAEMDHIADLIARTLQNRADPEMITALRAEVADLCAGFTPYPD
jgi:glycine/serine hydroxymethyltransferase